MALDRRDRRRLAQAIETEIAFGVSEVPSARVPKRPAAPEGDERVKELLELERRFSGCLECALSGSRTQVVFGAGNPSARLMFVGEAPGFEEDRQGLPFVGAAGQLLTKIIEAMKLRREDVYIANCLKCRPPQNRNPLPGEIAACQPILRRQLEIIRPRVICALGKFAAQTLLGTTEPITRLRGRFFDYGGAKLMPTFHPAYLLRNPADKKLAWEDMKKVMKELALSA